MVKVRNDLVGGTFERLEVIEQTEDYVAPSGEHRARWLCKCKCGNKTKATSSDLKRGNTKSCGCLNIETRTKHGLTKHPLMSVWLGIAQRCYNPKKKIYKYYGGRNIVCCQRWTDSFIAFYNACMELGWEKGLQIDRIDNDGNYEPSNCRFVTSSINCINRRMNYRNTSGYTGIRANGKNWQASIMISKKYVYLGSFKEKQSAVQRRNKYIIKNKLPNKIQKWRD